MKIYTKTGDGGTSSLIGGTRVSKSDLRLEAYGTADELNSFVGLLRAKLRSEEKQTDEQLAMIQNKLFNIGSELADERGLCQESYITAEDVSMIEGWIDEMSAEQEVTHGFILPGGNERIALAHVCRTVTRRLERAVVRLGEANSDSKNLDFLVQFLNRLSDFFFVLAKKIAFFDKIALFLWKK